MVVYNRPPKVSVSTSVVRPILKPLFFIFEALAPLQNTTDQSDRQPNNVAVRALDARDKSRRKTLDCIGAGAIDRLTCRDVPRDVFVCHQIEPHARSLDC